MDLETDSDRITEGTLKTSDGKVLPLEHTSVAAKIFGPIATVELNQRFRNNTGRPIEAVYFFPLPHEASVFRMSFKIGERVVQAVVKEKEEAKRIYEAARSEGRAATLLEQDKPSLFTLSVANVPPGEVILVTLAYQEKVAFDDGEFRFVFPMVTAERYYGAAAAPAPAASSQAPAQRKVQPPRAATGKRPANISLSVDLNAWRPIEPPRCVSHRTQMTQQSESAYRIDLAEDESIPNRDFVLAYRVVREAGRPMVYFSREADRIGTFMLLLTPPTSSLADVAIEAEVGTGGEGRAIRCGHCGGTLKDPGKVQEFPGIGPGWICVYCGAVVAVSKDHELRRVGLPRDIIFMVDRSCSMRGGSVAQARRAVRLILDQLNDDDAVQCMAFDHDRIFADGIGNEYMPMSKESIASIETMLAGVAARGGSELEEALQRAAKLPLRKGRVRIFVLMTDGAFGDEGRILRKAKETIGAQSILYVLGIGPAVNRYLIQRLARECGGASDVLLPTEDVETVVPRFARRVKQAGPLLKKLKLSWDDALPVDVYPSPIPDLFGGQTVQLFGRFNGSGKTRLALTGEKATGEPFRQQIDVELPEVSDQIPGLDRLWARYRIDARMDRLAQHPNETAEIRLEVLGLALKYSLLSAYTSLVAEDSEKRVDVPPDRIQIAAEVSHGEGEEAGKFDTLLSADDEDAHVMPMRSALIDIAEEEGSAGVRTLVGSTRAGTLGRASDAADGGERTRSRSAAREVDRAEMPKKKMKPMPSPRPAAPGAPPPPAAPAGFGAPPPAPGMIAGPMGGGGPPPAFAPPPAAYGPPPAAYAPPPPPPPMAAPAAAAPSASYSMPMSPAPEAKAARSKGGFFSKVRDFFSGSPADELEDEPSAPYESAPADMPALADESPPPPPPPPPAPPPSPIAAPDYEPPKPAVSPPVNRMQQGQARKAPVQAKDTEGYTKEMIEFANTRGIGEIDLVFLVDETGSMGTHIDEVKRRLLEIIDAIMAAPLCKSLRMGLVSFRDHPPEDHSYPSRALPLTLNLEEIREGVMRLQASGGGDEPESLTDGLYDLVRLNWRPRAAKVVVLVGDAPPHGVEPSGDSFPGGCPCGHHWFVQAENCREMGIVVHTVGCLPTIEGYAGAVDVFKTIAKTSRGLYLPLSEVSLLIPLITGVAETELDRQRIEEHIADVLAQHEKELQPADDPERIRFINDMLRDQNIRARRLVYNPNRNGPPPLQFRDLEYADIEGGLDRLRMLGRTSL